MDENGDPEGNYTLIGLDNQIPSGYGLYPIARFIGKESSTNLPVICLTSHLLIHLSNENNFLFNRHCKL